MGKCPPGLHLPLRTARPIWQDARKTSRRAQRLRGSLPSGCHGRPRPWRPGRDWPLPYLVQRTDHTLYATGRTGRRFPETSPVQARMQNTDGTGHRGRVRGVADQLPRFLQNFAGRRRRPGRGSDGPQRAATQPVRSASVRRLERIFISGFV